MTTTEGDYCEKCGTLTASHTVIRNYVGRELFERVECPVPDHRRVRVTVQLAASPRPLTYETDAAAKVGDTVTVPVMPWMVGIDGRQATDVLRGQITAIGSDYTGPCRYAELQR